ncbi:TetR/AcrR family transcriptional regulator [Amorphus orientalis]|uniref:AcrR family transcriptional regulator n=1 Tax=Amorphus orientalis TaxID=649198 RepID=A0AAE3VLQ4_9HYPH|nr:TetR family transcriptional regulator [Amorphus orientalis]MDQ0314464.1 AcrR family transcriptional regulator [Amorphus orientalis]
MSDVRPMRSRASAAKREAILAAAREVFAETGLEGASLRSVAARAGYTPAALYFHFESKEAIYAELLSESLGALGRRVADAAGEEKGEARLRSAAMAFFDFYAHHPQDLDLGFYLFRGGMKPAGLGRERDLMLNRALEAALRPIAEAATDLGADTDSADILMVDVFAHATGLLLLLHTGRIRMFGANARDLMQRYVDDQVRSIQGGHHAGP